MKQFFALLLVITLGVLLIVHLDSNEAFVNFGNGSLVDRVSKRYVDKSVTDDQDEVHFGDEDAETGSANIVTSIVVNYRSLDTLGEVTVLFVSALGVALLLGTSQTRLTLQFKPNFMLRVGSKALFGLILMMGVYMAMHGHLTPGGGFPGGSMIAAAFLLLYLADDQYRLKIKNIKILESLSGTVYVIIGLIGLVIGNYFLENSLDTGHIGDVFSAGLVPIIYVIIGLKVGSELANIIDHFLTEEGA